MPAWEGDENRTSENGLPERHGVFSPGNEVEGAGSPRRASHHRHFLPQERIEEASEALWSKKIGRTPLRPAHTLEGPLHPKVIIKAECDGKCRSFKVRGAANKMRKLSPEQLLKVAAASAGNHAQGVAVTSRDVGDDDPGRALATLVVPFDVAGVKLDAIRKIGGKNVRVVIEPGNFDKAKAFVQELVEKLGFVNVHPFDDIDVIEGQATATLEILREIKEPFVLVVPVGGGGLLAGAILAILASGRTDVTVVPVVHEKVLTLVHSLAQGRIVRHAIEGKIIADGTHVEEIGRIPFEVCQDAGMKDTDIVLVTEQDVRRAIRHLAWEGLRTEGAGALPAAALLTGKLARFDGQTLVLFASGGNIDEQKFQDILKEGDTVGVPTAVKVPVLAVDAAAGPRQAPGGSA